MVVMKASLTKDSTFVWPQLGQLYIFTLFNQQIRKKKEKQKQTFLKRQQITAAISR